MPSNPPPGFYDDMGAPPNSKPAPALAPKPQNAAAPQPATNRRTKLYDDMGPRAEPARSDDRTAAARRDAFEAGRTARVRAFYDDDPANAGAAKPDASAKPEQGNAPPGAPVKPLELEAPEGIDAKDPVFADFRQAAAELGLDPKGAGRMIELHQRALETQFDSWTKAAEADPAVMKLVPTANEVFKEFATPELKTLLDSWWGLSNHSGLISFLGKVGEELKHLRGRR